MLMAPSESGDAGHGDEIENEDMIQVDVPRALGRYRDVAIATVSMSGSTASSQ